MIDTLMHTLYRQQVWVTLRLPIFALRDLKLKVTGNPTLDDLGLP